MSRREDQSYKTLLIALTIIGIFLVCTIISQSPRIAANLQKKDNAFAGAVDPSDEVIGTTNPNATEPPDEPLEDDNGTGTPIATATPFPTVTTQATFTPFPTVTATTVAQETETPAPTFDIDIPGQTTPTLSPTPKPATKGASNIGLIIGAVVGTILLIIGIVWVILSRQKQSTNYTMPAPPSNPTYPPYQPDNFSNTPAADTSGWAQSNGGQQQGQGYTTPYDQYVNGSDPNQPK